MGQAKQKLSRTWGDRAHLVDGQMRIVRFKTGPRDPLAHRVEFYLDGLSKIDAYGAICAVKSAFERKDGCVDPAAPRPAGEPLWCVHVRGLKDAIIPTLNYDSAVLICDKLDEDDRASGPDAPKGRAVPRLWPGTPEQHAEAIAGRAEGVADQASLPVPPASNEATADAPTAEAPSE